MAVARRTQEPVPAFAQAFGEAGPGLPGGGTVAAMRRAAFERFMAEGIPTPRVEAWKYTNVAKLANVPMGLAPKAAIGLNDLVGVTAGGPKARRLIFVNGHVLPELSHVESLPAGVRVMSLGRALREMPERVEAVLAETEDDRSFTALNAAFAGAGAWIELADGAVLAEPVQLVYVTAGQPAAVMNHPRNVVLLGAGARLRLIESHVALADGQSLTNLVAQIRLGEGASLEHDRLQLQRDGATHIGKGFVWLGADARYRQTVASLGGALVRNEHEVRLQGERIECQLNGAYMPKGREQVDNLIRIHHEAPNCHSDQFYKGVVADHAHAVFAGKILVDKAAQKTNAYQKNDNLLLSDDAEVDTKPELEIYADDVKCSHGATVGDLDPRALFYLRSRGIDRDTAASILTFAFAAEVMERFGDPTVRRQARRAAAERLPGGAALKEIE
jgi:Fe-S cluster assembly protein SufD